MATFFCMTKILLVLNLQFILLKTVIADSKLHYFSTSCDNDKGNYTQNSLYQFNLHQVISNLRTKPSKTGLSNSISIGEPPNKVHGIYYCRGDSSPQLCHDCVQTAAQMILTNCTNQKESVIWFQECTLRYANRSIPGPADSSDDKNYDWWFSPENASDPSALQVVMSATMESLIQKAAYNKGYLGYATEEATLEADLILYCLVQCSPYLVGGSCEICLNHVFVDMKSMGNGGSLSVMMFRANCQMRYDTKLFYKELAPPPSPPKSPGPSLPASPNPAASSAARGVIFYVTRVGVPAVAFMLILIAMAFCVCTRMRRKRTTGNDKLPRSNNYGTIEGSNNAESYQYSLDTIRTATQNFSNDNKLGEGGFGPVYKGRLPDGQEVAVKRLSEDSRQGLREFTTEVQIVAKLQHRNLVRLLGFCVEGEEKLLVYEFVSNLSLDRFLFDPNKRQYLDWETRFKIILGIARGLLYLHQDSRVKIVHRDMKSSNILLDQEMTPKIADFGTAKLMKIDHTHAHTNKVFGTFGYMAPEYTRAGIFSIKSDVYSFGVILLEIISAKSNNSLCQKLGKDSLITYAQSLWSTGATLELVDPSLGSNFSSTEVLRCIQVGLLCVQDDPSSRPTMETVVHILNSNSSDIQLPAVASSGSSHTYGRGEHISGETDQFESYSGSNTQLTDLYPR